MRLIMKIDKMNYEEALKKLEEAKKIIDNPNSNLEEMLLAYEDAAKYYQHCNQILENAEQKINKISASLKRE